jgi:hypothetical protein
MKYILAGFILFISFACTKHSNQNDAMLIRIMERNNADLEETYKDHLRALSELYRRNHEKNEKYYNQSLVLEHLANNAMFAVHEMDIDFNKIKIKDKVLNDSLLNYSKHLDKLKKSLDPNNYLLQSVLENLKEILNRNSISIKLKRLLLENLILTDRNNINNNLLKSSEFFCESFHSLLPIVMSDCDRIKTGKVYHAHIFLTFQNGCNPLDLEINDCLYNGKPAKLKIDKYSEYGAYEFNFIPTQKGHYSVRGHLSTGEPNKMEYPFQKDIVVE